MSEIDRIKEEVGWLKLIFGGLIAVDMSLVAWLAQNYEGAEIVLVVMAGIAIVIVTSILVAVNRSAFRRMAKLENL